MIYLWAFGWPSASCSYHCTWVSCPGLQSSAFPLHVHEHELGHVHVHVHAFYLCGIDFAPPILTLDPIWKANTLQREVKLGRRAVREAGCGSRCWWIPMALAYALDIIIRQTERRRYRGRAEIPAPTVAICCPLWLIIGSVASLMKSLKTCAQVFSIFSVMLLT